MYLRALDVKDAPLMFEWMQDIQVTHGLHGDYSKVVIEQAVDFILNTSKLVEEKHFAIVNDMDEYIGTASLRHIDTATGLAEFAIVIRKPYWAKGYAWQGMLDTIKYAFEKISLDKIYWRVNRYNERAIHFFKKHGFNVLDDDVPKDIIDRHANETDLIWFALLKGDDYANIALSRGSVADCKIIKINTIPTIEAGELSYFEGMRDIDFEIKRIYYISKVPEGVKRGFHAHRKLKQLLFCPYGKIQLILENEMGKEEITLSDPSTGVIIAKPTWREMLWLQKDSVLCVAASDFYKADDYIRNYDEFIQLIKD